MPQGVVPLDLKVREFSRKASAAFSPAKVILFGSRARGDWLLHSDYDFIIVSPKFEGMDFLERIRQAYLKCDVRFNAEILCYTPEEFARKSKEMGTVASAAKEGVVI